MPKRVYASPYGGELMAILEVGGEGGNTPQELAEYAAQLRAQFGRPAWAQNLDPGDDGPKPEEWARKKLSDPPDAQGKRKVVDR